MNNIFSFFSCPQKCFLSAAVFILGASICLPVYAEDLPPDTSDFGRIIVMEENDKFGSSDDRHYTQGMRAAYLSRQITPDGSWDQPYGLLSDALPIFDGSDRKRKYEWTVVGQSIFTPTNTLSASPSTKDRPYAAWLYTGVSLLQEHSTGLIF